MQKESCTHRSVSILPTSALVTKIKALCAKQKHLLSCPPPILLCPFNRLGACQCRHEWRDKFGAGTSNYIPFGTDHLFTPSNKPSLWGYFDIVT